MRLSLSFIDNTPIQQRVSVLYPLRYFDTPIVQQKYLLRYFPITLAPSLLMLDYVLGSKKELDSSLVDSLIGAVKESVAHVEEPIILLESNNNGGHTSTEWFTFASLESKDSLLDESIGFGNMDSEKDSHLLHEFMGAWRQNREATELAGQTLARRTHIRGMAVHSGALPFFRDYIHDLGISFNAFGERPFTYGLDVHRLDGWGLRPFVHDMINHHSMGKALRDYVYTMEVAQPLKAYKKHNTYDLHVPYEEELGVRDTLMNLHVINDLGTADRPGVMDARIVRGLIDAHRTGILKPLIIQQTLLQLRLKVRQYPTVLHKIGFSVRSVVSDLDILTGSDATRRVFKNLHNEIEHPISVRDIAHSMHVLQTLGASHRVITHQARNLQDLFGVERDYVQDLHIHQVLEKSHRDVVSGLWLTSEPLRALRDLNNPLSLGDLQAFERDVISDLLNYRLLRADRHIVKPFSKQWLLESERDYTHSIHVHSLQSSERNIAQDLHIQKSTEVDRSVTKNFNNNTFLNVVGERRSQKPLLLEQLSTAERNEIKDTLLQFLTSYVRKNWSSLAIHSAISQESSAAILNYRVHTADLMEDEIYGELEKDMVDILEVLFLEKDSEHVLDENIISELGGRIGWLVDNGLLVADKVSGIVTFDTGMLEAALIESEELRGIEEDPSMLGFLNADPAAFLSEEEVARLKSREGDLSFQDSAVGGNIEGEKLKWVGVITNLMFMGEPDQVRSYVEYLEQSGTIETRQAHLLESIVKGMIERKFKGDLIDELPIPATTIEERKAALEESLQMQGQGLIYNYEDYPSILNTGMEIEKWQLDLGYGLPELYDPYDPFNVYYPWVEQFDSSLELLQNHTWTFFGDASWSEDKEAGVIWTNYNSSHPSGFVVSDLNSTDYVFSVTARVDSKAGDDDWIGVVFKYVDENNYFKFQIRGADVPNPMTLHRVVGGIATPIGSAMSPFRWYYDTDYVIKVSYIDRHIKIWVNGNLQFDIYDS